MSSLKKFEPRCYESFHLHPREWGLLDVCQRVTRGCKTTLFFDGPTIATWFKGVSKSAIYRSAARLVAGGWLIPLNGTGKKRKSGSARFESTQYRVLGHEEWIQKHKGQCRPFPGEGTESIPKSGNGPFPEEGTVHSHSRKKPFPNEGRSSVVPISVESFSVKSCSVGAGSDSLDLNHGQHGSGEATLSQASIPESGNGNHTVPEPRKIDWNAIQAKVEAEEREKRTKQ